ncbi:MAG: rhodanese-like domain-containing protein [Bdellovibrionaceae bacterium]|nr:rhodanese-like domain-containing protein [Pseudobdellovibrionaceae bacterium]
MGTLFGLFTFIFGAGAYKVYCRSGNRSGQAMQLMKSLGFKDVENLGSLMQASQRLSRKCEGRNSC